MKKPKSISSREDELKSKLKKLKSEVKSLRTNEAVWQNYFNYAPNVIFTVNRKYEITFMNYTLKGFAIEDVIGKSIFNFLPEESHKAAKGAMDKAFRSGKKQSFEARGFGEQGKIVWYSTEVGPIKNKKKIDSLVVIATDITKRVETIEALKSSEQKFSIIFDNAPYAASLSILPEGKILEINKAFEKYFGFSKKDVIGKTSFEVGINPDAKKREEIIKQILAEGFARELELQLKTSSGAWRIFNINVDVIKIGELRYSLQTAEDITDWKNASQMLQQNEQKFSLIFKKSHFAAALTNLPDGKFVEINEEFVHQFEYSEEAVIGKTSLQLGLYLDINERQRIGEIMQRNGFVRNAETKMKTKSGKIIDVLVSSDIVEIGSEKFILTTSKNITERKQIETAFRETLTKLISTLESMKDGFVSLDKDWRYTYMNREAGLIFGRNPAEMIGKHIWTEFPEGIGQPFHKAYEKAMKEQVAIQLQDYYPPYDKWFENRIYPTKDGISIFFLDITDRIKALEALRQSRQTLQLFVEHAPAAIAMLDNDLKYIAYSKRFLHDYELGEQNLIGKFHYEVFPEMPQRWKDTHQRCLAGAVEKADEDPFIRADGSIDWVRWEIHPWRNENGVIGGILLFSEVITERKSAQLRLEASEAQLRENNISLIRLLTQRDSDFTFEKKIAEQNGQLRILYLENDPRDVELLKAILEESRIKYNLVHAANKEQFIASLKEKDFDIVILDFHLSDINGIQAIEHMKQYSPGIPAIVFTGSSTEMDIANMLTAGAWNYVTKDHPSRIVLAIQQAVERKRFIDDQVSVASVLRKNQERFQALIENSVEGIALLDNDGKFLYGSPSTSHILGYSLDTFEQKNIFDLIHEEDLKNVKAEFSNLIGNPKQTVNTSFRMKHNDGSFRVFEMILTNLIATPTVSAIVCNYRDITEKSKAIEDRINLMNRLIESEEIIKKTAAQQLHDEIGQNLTALMINVNYVSSKLTDDSQSKIKKRLDDSVILLNETIEQVRNIMTELRSFVLDDYGLNAALSYSLSKFSETNNITVQYDGKDFEPQLPNNIAYALYRVTQEVLHNIAKHAQASNVYVLLEEIERTVKLTIRDDGVGFDYDLYSQSKYSRGIGLITIEERINFIGGKANIFSSKEEGTTITIEVAR